MPKLVPKSKPVDVDDKKTGTGDKTTPQLPNDTSFQTNSSSNNKKIKFDNSKSKADISKLKKKITDEKKETLNKLKEFNDKISQRKEEILKLTNENNVLLKELNRIKNEVDDKVKYKRVYKYKDDQIEKEANQINKDIEIFEKELKNTKKMTLLGYAKEKEYLEKFLNQNDENVLNQMKEEVNYHKEILEINKNKYNELKKNTATHNSCKNKIKQLKQRLIDLQNQLNYENKFSDKIKLELSKDDEEDNDMYLEEESIDERFQKRNRYKNRRYEESKLMKRGLSNPGFNNRKLKIPPPEKFQDAKEVQKSRKLNKTILPIWEELEKVNERYIKSMNEKSTVDLFKGEENPLPNCLFTNNEKKVLCKLIPEENLENFSERFFKLERERQEMEDLYYSNQDKKKELEENKTKIDHSALKMKELNQTAILIKGELTKLNKMIKDRKQALKIQSTKLKEVNYLYNIKNRENIQLKQHLSLLNEKIQNGELVIQEQYKEEEEKKKKNKTKKEENDNEYEESEKEEKEENEENENEENEGEENNNDDNNEIESKNSLKSDNNENEKGYENENNDNNNDEGNNSNNNNNNNVENDEDEQ